MITRPEPIPLIEVFARLANDMGARQARPAPDGSVLFLYEGAAVLRDESTLFDLTGPRRRALLTWHPEPRSPGHSTPGLAGTVTSRGIHPEQVHVLAKRLGRVAPFHQFRTLRPFAIRSLGPACVLDLSFVEKALSEYLIVGVTTWGSYLLSACEMSANGLRLRFEAPHSRVVFELRPLAGGPGGADPGPSFSAPPFRVIRVLDDRTDAQRGNLEHAVDAYLLYALSRAFPPHQEIRSADPDAPDPTDSELFDRRDESEPTRFFIEPLERTLGALEGIGTLIEADDAIAFVTFAHSTCMTKIPLVETADHVGAMWHRFHELPMSLARKPWRTVDLKELDLILGDQDGFREQIRIALAGGRTRLLAVLSTCIGDLIGLDVRGVVEEVSGGRDVPLFIWNARTINGTSIASLWEHVLRLASSDLTPCPGLVNLVGFAAEDTTIAAGIRADLAAFGVRVNALLIPSVRTPQVDRFRQAHATIVNRDSVTQEEFRTARRLLDEATVLDLDPPFGPAATARFCEAVALAAGVDAPPNAGTERFAPYSDRWEALKIRASRHEVLIVVDAVTAIYVSDPARLYGLNVVSLLLEMGFGVRILWIGDDEPAIGVSADKTRVPIDRLADAAALPSWLSNSRASLVFTEYVQDSRVTSAGKLPVTPRDFEPGFEGSLKTLLRLVRLAECAFFDTFDPRGSGGGAQ